MVQEKKLYHNYNIIIAQKCILKHGAQYILNQKNRQYLIQSLLIRKFEMEWFKIHSIERKNRKEKQHTEVYK